MLLFQHHSKHTTAKKSGSVVDGVLVTYGIPKGFCTSVPGNKSRWAVAEKSTGLSSHLWFFFSPFETRTLSFLSGLPRPYRAIRSFVKAFWMWRSVRVN